MGQTIARDLGLEVSEEESQHVKRVQEIARDIMMKQNLETNTQHDEEDEEEEEGESILEDEDDNSESFQGGNHEIYTEENHGEEISISIEEQNGKINDGKEKFERPFQSIKVNNFYSRPHKDGDNSDDDEEEEHQQDMLDGMSDDFGNDNDNEESRDNNGDQKNYDGENGNNQTFAAGGDKKKQMKKSLENSQYARYSSVFKEPLNLGNQSDSESLNNSQFEVFSSQSDIEVGSNVFTQELKKSPNTPRRNKNPQQSISTPPEYKQSPIQIRNTSIKQNGSEKSSRQSSNAQIAMSRQPSARIDNYEKYAQIFFPDLQGSSQKSQMKIAQAS